MLCHALQSLTGDGSEDVGDEDLHQALVQAVVTVAAPAQHRLVLAQQHQAGFWEALLWLIVPVKIERLHGKSRTPTAEIVIPCQKEWKHLHSHWSISSLALAEPPEGFP